MLFFSRAQVFCVLGHGGLLKGFMASGLAELKRCNCKVPLASDLLLTGLVMRGWPSLAHFAEVKR